MCVYDEESVPRKLDDLTVLDTELDSGLATDVRNEKSKRGRRQRDNTEMAAL